MASSNGAESNISKKFNPSEIGFFDPHFDRLYGDGAMFNVGKDTYCRNIHPSLDMAKEIAKARDPSHRPHTTSSTP